MIQKLYGEYHKELLRFCKKMTGNREQAEDLVQETFLRAMEHLPLLETLEAPKCRAWLYRTAKNLLIDQRRHASFETFPEEMPETGECPSAFDAYENRQLLNRLPDEEKVIFALRYMEGYNATEIGRLFSLPPATVRAKLATARKRLRKELEESL